MDHVVSFTALESKIYMRSYKILLKRSGQTTPLVDVSTRKPSDIHARHEIASGKPQKKISFVFAMIAVMSV